MLDKVSAYQDFRHSLNSYSGVLKTSATAESLPNSPSFILQVKIFVNKNLMESDGVIPEYKTVWTDLAGHGFARLLPDARLDV